MDRESSAQEGPVSPSPGSPAPLPTAHKRDLEASLANLLTAGTAIAAIVLLVGLVIYLLRDHGTHLDFKEFVARNQSGVFGVFREAAQMNGASVMQLGVVLLILTPVTRVLFTLFAFLYKRDWMYVVVTVIVLGVLLYGLFGNAELH